MPNPLSGRIQRMTPRLAAALLLALPVLPALGQTGPVEGRPPAERRTYRPPNGRIAASAEPADLSALLPREAEITLNARGLRVVAENSSLLPILERVAQMTGMEILNLPEESPRVSGSYGPGPVRKVLIDLMADSGCNFVMAGGTAASAPAKLLLENRGPERRATATASAPAPPAAGRGLPGDGRADASEPLGPGALRPTPADVPTDENDRMQRNLQRLEHIQAQQQQQNAPQ